MGSVWMFGRSNHFPCKDFMLLRAWLITYPISVKLIEWSSFHGHLKLFELNSDSSTASNAATWLPIHVEHPTTIEIYVPPMPTQESKDHSCFSSSLDEGLVFLQNLSEFTQLWNRAPIQHPLVKLDHHPKGGVLKSPILTSIEVENPWMKHQICSMCNLYWLVAFKKNSQDAFDVTPLALAIQHPLCDPEISDVLKYSLPSTSPTSAEFPTVLWLHLLHKGWLPIIWNGPYTINMGKKSTNITDTTWIYIVDGSMCV